jgi:hypothetical protein
LQIAALALYRDSTVWFSVILLLYASIGLLIALKRPQNPIGWFWLAGTLFLAANSFATSYAAFSVAQSAGMPGASFAAAAAGPLGNLGFSLILPFTFLLFPTGSLPSPRWRPLLWLIVANIVVGCLAVFTPPALRNQAAGEALIAPALSSLTELANRVYTFTALASIILTPLAMIWRYRGAGPTERQQLKWLAFGSGAVILIGLFGQGVTSLLRLQGPTWDLFLNLLWLLVNVIIIASVAIAILAHRLYDIDILIRKTIAYTIVTALLTLVFAGFVLVAQRLLTALAGEGSPVAIVASTLAIAALFSPLRRRVQDFVDRRFYRRKYDAQRVLAGFAEVARKETDVDRLTRGLAGAVTETVQPKRVAIWLRES